MRLLNRRPAALVLVLAWLVATPGVVIAQAIPLVTIDDGPKKQTSKRTARFAFSSDDPAATFECRIDSASFAPCASPLSIRGLARSRHTFQVRAIAPTGSVSVPAVQKWKVVKWGGG